MTLLNPLFMMSLTIRYLRYVQLFNEYLLHHAKVPKGEPLPLEFYFAGLWYKRIVY